MKHQIKAENNKLFLKCEQSKDANSKEDSKLLIQLNGVEYDNNDVDGWYEITPKNDFDITSDMPPYLSFAYTYNKPGCAMFGHINEIWNYDFLFDEWLNSNSLKFINRFILKGANDMVSATNWTDSIKFLKLVFKKNQDSFININHSLALSAQTENIQKLFYQIRHLIKCKLITSNFIISESIEEDFEIFAKNQNVSLTVRGKNFLDRLNHDSFFYKVKSSASFHEEMTYEQLVVLIVAFENKAGIPSTKANLLIEC